MIWQVRLLIVRQAWLVLVIIVALLGTSAVALCQSPEVRVEFVKDPPARFVLHAPPARLDAASPKHVGRELFAVGVVSTQDLPSLLGKYRYEEGRVAFIPKYPLTPGVRYRVKLSAELAKDVKSAELEFQVPPPRTKSEAEVVAIYPSAKALPANILKFYIHFSEPMNRGEAYQRLQLLHAGQVIEHPFLELAEELWDGEQTRLTLFMHPGRVKRGLKPRDDAGPVLEIGKSYTLRVSDAWTAAKGLTLTKPYTKTFVVAPEDHTQPALEQWKIETPSQKTRKPLTLTFNEALDHAMLHRVLVLKDAKGNQFAGRVEVVADESQWKFFPTQPWEVGSYSIEVATNLEDLCGNSIARPFEVQLQSGVQMSRAPKVAIEFSVTR